MLVVYNIQLLVQVSQVVFAEIDKCDRGKCRTVRNVIYQVRHFSVNVGVMVDSDLQLILCLNFVIYQILFKFGSQLNQLKIRSNN